MLAVASLLLLLGASGCALGSVQNAGPFSGYLSGTEYVYSYDSLTQLSVGVNVSLEAQVSSDNLVSTV